MASRGAERRLASRAQKRAAGLMLAAAGMATAAWAGHELPVYPSFYPHQIDIATLAPQAAPAALRGAAIHAYVGGAMPFSGAPPETIGSVESLGGLVLVRLNPHSAWAGDEAAACAATQAVARAAGQGDVVPHPYPVTPLHGDYIDFADLAAAAAARLAAAAEVSPALKVKAAGRLAAAHPQWSASGDDWDVEVSEVEAGALVATAVKETNGWLAPPWLKAGWFQAKQLLADTAASPEQSERAAADFARLTSGDYTDLPERINLERDLVTALTAGCRAAVAGYTLRREYFNREFSAGIENIGFDSLTGLQSPMFLRTVKLKDFPWNGWLKLGIGAAPASAWNPIAGMTDPFSRLMWSALGDPALLRAPYDAGWMLNRIADLPAEPGP